MNLGKQIAKELILLGEAGWSHPETKLDKDGFLIPSDQKITTVIGIYPGRFQPFGAHHAEAYEWLTKQGLTQTYVATSDKVQLPKSPFSFAEKKKIINSYGISAYWIKKVKNPYKAEEILKEYDPESTAAVFMIGKKDAQRLGGKFFRPWKNEHGNDLVGYRDGAYYIEGPHISINVPGYGEMSGTAIRQALGDKSLNRTQKVKIFKGVFGHMKNYNLIVNKLEKLNETIIEEFLTTINIKDYLIERSTNAGGTNTDVDDGPRYFYGNQKSYRKQTANMAKRLGFEVVNYIMKDTPLEIHNTEFPTGPVMTVSYYPTGVKGGKKAGTDYLRDFKGKPAYKYWKKYIKNIAQQVGYKLLDYLDAEESIDSSKAEILKPTTLREDINLPVNIGDTVKMGRFKNKKVVVKTISWNEKGDLLINGRSAMRMRIIPQEPKPKTLGESLAIQLITEGGAAGHMNHPFDDRDITFGDMKQMIRLSLEGKLNIESGVQEKTDGQNLLVTFKDGQVKAARNKTTIKNPMDYIGVIDKFAGRGQIQNAFAFAMRDLGKALKKVPRNKLDEIFQNGARFLNMEIIYPATSNVIIYGPKAYIQFHGVDEYDLVSATKIDSYPEYAPLLQKLIADVNANIQKKFEIIPPKILTTKQLPDFEKKEKYFIDKVTFLQKQFQLKDTDELVMWHEMWWKGKIEQAIPYATDDIKLGLLKRWAYFDKSFRMNNKTIPDPKTLQIAKDFDKQDFAKQNKQNVYNFEKIFLELGVEILHNISDYLSVVPSDATATIRHRIANKIKMIQKSKDLASLEKLKFELKRIEDLGGFEKLVPSEGIVFVYKGKTYKLTGLFAPINQLLGIGGLADK